MPLFPAAKSADANPASVHGYLDVDAVQSIVTVPLSFFQLPFNLALLSTGNKDCDVTDPSDTQDRLSFLSLRTNGAFMPA